MLLGLGLGITDLLQKDFVRLCCEDAFTRQRQADKRHDPVALWEM